MKQFHTNSLILTGILVLAVLSAGCATKQTPHTVETNEKKEVHLRTEHLFFLEKPTPENPVVTFTLMKNDYYRTDKKVVDQVTHTSKPGSLMSLALLPLQVTGAIVTLGELSVYKTLTTKKTEETGSRWLTDTNARQIKRAVPVSGQPVHLFYEYCQEENKQVLTTNTRGEIQKDLRQMAESVALDPSAPEFVDLTVSVPGLPATHPATVRISQKHLLDIYNHCSSAGTCNN